ncbi:uncharacterized protein ACMZJ9_009351 isoform 2-T2 [Mantella aurantiaca]
MKREPENLVIEKNGNCKIINQQTESPILDRRLMALKYSETFKITSRAEASVVLKLTQQLSDSLEQYFLKCKGPGVQDSRVADNTDEIYETSKKILPSSECGNGKLGSQSRNLKKYEDSDEIPFMSAQSISHRYQDPPQPISLDGFVSQSCSSTSPYHSNVTDSIFFSTHSHVSGPFRMEQNSEHSPCVSQNSLNTGMEIDESESSSLQSSSTQATPSSSQTQRKTSKTLSPDILQLLKGKDANTVTNILKTLSPFYPALQDVNLEILAQVLVNTGALD